MKIPSGSPALIFGSAVHKAIEEYHKSIVDSRLTKREMMDCFEEAWEQSILNSEVKIDFKKEAQKGNLFDIGLDIICKYRDDNKNCPPPLMFLNEEGAIVPAVEIGFNVEIDMPDYKMTRPISGKIDLITQYEKNGDIYVIDHKTSSEDYTTFKIETAVQLTLYAYAFRKMLKEGKFPYVEARKEDFAGYNVFKKMEGTKKNPESYGEISYIRKEIRQADIDHMKTVYAMMSKGVEAQVFMPNYGRACSWCDYKNTCETFKYNSGNSE
jgi:hypothetical protein